MLKEDLMKRILVGPNKKGKFDVSIEYRNRRYFFTSTNMQAYEVIKSGKSSHLFTVKQAYMCLYREFINPQIKVFSKND